MKSLFPRQCWGYILLFTFWVGKAFALVQTPLPKSLPPRSSSKFCDLRFSNGVLLKSIPVVETFEQQKQGLSHQKHISRGMLFTWPIPAYRVFWMKDTHVPLSVGFFSADGVLFQIEPMHPNTETYHFSNKPATAALELPTGEFQKRKLVIGSRLLSTHCRKIFQ